MSGAILSTAAYYSIKISSRRARQERRLNCQLSALDAASGVASGEGLHFRDGDEVEVLLDGMLEARRRHGEVYGLLRLLAGCAVRASAWGLGSLAQPQRRGTSP